MELTIDKNKELALESIQELKDILKIYHKGSIEKYYMQAQYTIDQVNWLEVSDDIQEKYNEILVEVNKHYKKF